MLCCIISVLCRGETISNNTAIIYIYSTGLTTSSKAILCQYILLLKIENLKFF